MENYYRNIVVNSSLWRNETCFFKRIKGYVPTLVQHQAVHLCPVLGGHHAPWLNHLGIHSGNEGPCRDHAHQVPKIKISDSQSVIDALQSIQVIQYFFS